MSSRLRHRSWAMIATLLCAASMLVLASSVPSVALTKPPKTTVKACQETIRQARHSLSHFADFITLSDQLNTSVKTMLNSSGQTSDAVTFVGAVGAYNSGIQLLGPQVEDAVNAYSDAEKTCMKALGLKEKDVTVP
jgi:hypothetical protein